MCREALKTDELAGGVKTGYDKYPKGLVANVQQGDVPSRSQRVATYVAKYVVSLPLSLRRIDRYDGQSVTYHYRSPQTARVERERVAVYTLIGRMSQHVFAKGFKRIRYSGVQATQTFEKIKGLIGQALAKGQGIVKGAVKMIAAKRYRERYRESAGWDPFMCPHCQHEMSVWQVGHLKYGGVYDELAVMRKGR